MRSHDLRFHCTGQRVAPHADAEGGRTVSEDVVLGGCHPIREHVHELRLASQSRVEVECYMSLLCPALESDNHCLKERKRGSEITRTRCDHLEQKLFERPVITVPAITIASDFDGPAGDGTAYAKKFSGKYSHRTISGGIGHNLPQEAPKAFAETILEVDGY